MSPAQCRADDKQRRHVAVVDEMALGRPHRGEAEPFSLAANRTFVIGTRPVRLAWPHLCAEQSEPKGHTGEATSALGRGPGRLWCPFSEPGHGRGLFHPRRDLAFVEVVHGFEVHAARVLAHPDRRNRRYGRE